MKRAHWFIGIGLLLACYTWRGAPGAGTDTPHRFFTAFTAAEDPISEGGAWINGKNTGLDWANVKTIPGLAFGADLPTQYADPTAVLTGTWGPDQRAQGKVLVKSSFTDCCREVELRLRSRIEAHSITGYEILCSVVSSSRYLSIVRWNGPLNDFTELDKIDRGCSDGDVLVAGIIGSTITVWKNGVQMLQVSDGKYSSGSPGIGFYNLSRDIWSHLGFKGWDRFGFSNFSATDDAIDR